MKKYIGLIVLTSVLVGCSTLTSMLPGKSGGVDVNTNAQVGQENTQQVVANQTTTSVGGDQTNSTVSGQVGEVTVSNIPLWYILLLILAVAFPTPSTMWNGFKRGVGGTFRFIFNRPKKKKEEGA